jgi:hypothetical protein
MSRKTGIGKPTTSQKNPELPLHTTTLEPHHFSSRIIMDGRWRSDEKKRIEKKSNCVRFGSKYFENSALRSRALLVVCVGKLKNQTLPSPGLSTHNRAMEEVRSSEFESDDLVFDEYFSSLLPALEPSEFQEDGSGIVNFKSKGSKHDKVMVSTEWLSAILFSIQILRKSRPSVIDISHFTSESHHHRYTIKQSTLPLFKIFPWFHANCRFRQTLKANFSRGPTIEKVIEASNYFFSRGGGNYSEHEIQFLQDYYQKMEIPIPSNCLTTIVEVYDEFRCFQETIGPSICGEKRVITEISSDFEDSDSNKSKLPNDLPKQDWYLSLTKALHTLQKNVSTEVGPTNFTVELSQNRFTVKHSSLSKLKIFPWFYDSTKGRFRETLKRESSQGLTIEHVIEAINYFLRKNGSDYTEAEIQFLRSYYETMEIPAPSACLTPIVALFREFDRFQRIFSPQLFFPEFDHGAFLVSVEPQSSPSDGIGSDAVHKHAEQLVDLRNRVGRLESRAQVQQSKRPRRGGDRACWFRIRDVDYPSRMEWCTPGGVFGLYSDGVGPLLPNHVCPRRSVVVYSVNPDTVEAHPDPSHEDHYVRVVMVRFLVLSPLCDSSFLIVVFIFSHLFCVRSEKLL